MKKTVHKKGSRKLKEVKEDSKQDLIFANYLIEDISAFETLLPKNEAEELSDELVQQLVECVKKIKNRLSTFSTAFRTKYEAVGFYKLQSISKAFIRKEKENPRYRYSFLLKEYKAGKVELQKCNSKSLSSEQ